MENFSELPLKKTLPVVTGASFESDEELKKELEAYEKAERERLGIFDKRRQWADNMTKSTMKKAERSNVTLLMGGLTAAQDFLLEGALRGLGYRTEHLKVPDNHGLQVGKEFGNRGQCNPTYFTVGNLVAHLQMLRDEKGMTAEEIVKNHVFVTAGACGPCRFGMYVTEYRKALRDAGFDGFRIMLFQQQGGLSQATGDDPGLEFNFPFFKQLVKAIVAGDVLNAIGYRIRPYEVTPGATNAAMEEAKKLLYKSLYEQTSILKALWKCRKIFKAVEVDRLRPRPKTSIIGEFWAMTTEGDGNYHLQKFLESEGAENDIQLTTAWLLYNIWEVDRDTRVREDLRGADSGHFGLSNMGPFQVAKRHLNLWAAERALRIAFQCFAWPAGLFDYHLPDMNRIADVADKYYSNDLRGGEGHMEVGKVIVNVVDAKAHITVSVKPFGCMPSSGVSDGVQSIVMAQHPGTIFCAVETSGDGATNFYSRVQMYMFKARLAAQEELARTYKEMGVSEQQVRAFLAKNPKFASPLYHPPHEVAGTAANLVREVTPIMRQSMPERAARATGRGLLAAARLAWIVPKAAIAVAVFAASPETWRKVREDITILATRSGHAG